jgi:hypothetical protein
MSRTAARAGLIAAAMLLLPLGGSAAQARTDGVTTTVLESSERELRLRFDLPEARLLTREVDGRRYEQLVMPGTGTGGATGTPGLPAHTRFFGVPTGADVSLRVDDTDGHTVEDVLLYPAQEEPVDSEPFVDPPFEIDREAYDADRDFPAVVADSGAVGNMRDVRVGGVSITGGQYNPRRETLRVYESVTVTITFGGGNRGIFATEAINGPWNHAFHDDYQSLLNIETILDRLGPLPNVRFCGAELLIITSHELRPAADALAVSRRAMGHITKVKEVGLAFGQVGMTPEQIRGFIRQELTDPDCQVHPSYVILLGDTADVPTFLVPCQEGGDVADCDVASDFPYSLDGVGDDLFADVQLGRLPAPDLPSADALVDKINGYATTRPAALNDDFYDHATVTSYFEPPLRCTLKPGETGTPNCNSQNPPVTGEFTPDYTDPKDARTFTMASENARDAMLAEGKSVDRVYHADPRTSPELFWDGTEMPAELRKPGFAWNGAGDDVVSHWNRGRFLVFHRGHGGHSIWGDPIVTTADVPSLTNGPELPVVFSVNCSSAMFDIPGNPSLVERMVLKPDGGAVAAFGDSRVSPHFPNTALAQGFFDAMFPTAAPEFGGAPTRRLGDILVRAKQYLATVDPATFFGGELYKQSHLYGLFGDPTIQMWSEHPYQLPLDRIRARFDGIELQVEFPIEAGAPRPEGTVVTLLDDGEPIGRGVVGPDGTATFEPDAGTDGGDLTVSYDQDGALPAVDSVE